MHQKRASYVQPCSPRTTSNNPGCGTTQPQKSGWHISLLFTVSNKLYKTFFALECWWIPQVHVTAIIRLRISAANIAHQLQSNPAARIIWLPVHNIHNNRRGMLQHIGPRALWNTSIHGDRYKQCHSQRRWPPKVAIIHCLASWSRPCTLLNSLLTTGHDHVIMELSWKYVKVARTPINTCQLSKIQIKK